jgi:hypothetical protein
MCTSLYLIDDLHNLDKNGDLVGSYIVTSDGIVTKYDEHGDPID